MATSEATILKSLGLEGAEALRRTTLLRAIMLAVLLTLATIVSACDAGSSGSSESKRSTDSGEDASLEASVPEYEIVDIIPMDAIPAIDDPQFWEGENALENYPDDMLVLGVSFEDDARAYSVPFLSGHEVVNDTVSGRPITVTW